MYDIVTNVAPYAQTEQNLTFNWNNTDAIFHQEMLLAEPYYGVGEMTVQAAQPEPMINWNVLPAGEPAHTTTLHQSINYAQPLPRGEERRAFMSNCFYKDVIGRVEYHICKICGGRVERKGDAFRHWMSKHGNRRPTCIKCKKEFSRKDALKIHVTKCKGLQ